MATLGVFELIWVSDWALGKALFGIAGVVGAVRGSLTCDLGAGACTRTDFFDILGFDSHFLGAHY